MANRFSNVFARWLATPGAVMWVLAAGVTLAAQAPAPDPSAAAAQRAAERIRALQRESEGLASQERSLLVDLRKLEVERELKSAELANVERELRETRAKVTATIARAAVLRDAADTERPGVEQRLPPPS